MMLHQDVIGSTPAGAGGTVGRICECNPSVGHKPPQSPAAAPASIIATPARVTAHPRRRRSWEPGRGKVQTILLGCSAEAERILLIINNNSMSATADSRLASLSKIVIACCRVKRRHAVLTLFAVQIPCQSRHTHPAPDMVSRTSIATRLFFAAPTEPASSKITIPMRLSGRAASGGFPEDRLQIGARANRVNSGSVA
jgi:hypothetical protein